MKHSNLFKMFRLILLVTLLAAVMAIPAVAQEPVDEGEFEAALSFHGGFALAPQSNWFIPVSQNVPSGGKATTEFVVTDVEDLFFVSLAFDYDDAIAVPETIEPGTLFDGLTKDVDYRMEVTLPGRVIPKSPTEWPIPSFGPGFPTNRRAYVDIYVTNPNHPLTPIQGNGSLIKINWQIQPVVAGSVMPIDFTLANLQDKYGNYIQPCFPASACDNVDPPQPPNPPRVFPDPWLEGGPVVGKLNVVPPNPGDFRVALEGGKGSAVAPAISVNATTTLGGVPFSGIVGGDGNVTMGFAPPYTSLSVTRPGYLTFQKNNVANLPPLVTLLAGDINGDNAVNIADLATIAGLLNITATPANELMDYNDDGIITITDLALVAKNYGLAGPRTR